MTAKGSIPAPDSRYVHANGLTLHYWDWPGFGAGAAVLLHATGFLARLWEPVAARLSERYRVLALDQRGHGDSDKPRSGYQWLSFVQDFLGFLEALGLGQVLVIGHSGGGAVAAYAAATRPEAVSRAVLIEPIIFPPAILRLPQKPEASLAQGARRRRMVWGSGQEMFDSYRSRLPFSSWREDVLWLYVNHGTRQREDGQVELKCPGEIEAQVFETSRSLDTFSVLANIRCPVLVMRGEHSETYTFTVAEAVAREIPQARLVTVREAGHFAPMERPDAVLEEIQRFLNDG